MGIVKKTKAERAADAAANRDKPLASSPDAKPIGEFKTAIADINKRVADRKTANDLAQQKLEESRIARSKAKNKGSVDANIQGLASFKNTLGRQYYKQPDSENS